MKFQFPSISYSIYITHIFKLCNEQVIIAPRRTTSSHGNQASRNNVPSKTIGNKDALPIANERVEAPPLVAEAITQALGTQARLVECQTRVAEIQTQATKAQAQAVEMHTWDQSSTSFGGSFK